MIEKEFSVKTRQGNFAVERFTDGAGEVRYRLMHDRRYITAETFKAANVAIAVLLEHLGRVFVRHLSLFADGQMEDCVEC